LKKSIFYFKGIGGEAKSLTTTTARSSLNDTTVPLSARSVSFKEHPIVHEIYDPPSSKSQQSTVISANRNSVLDRIGRLIF
jgi:hypothetical protein